MKRLILLIVIFLFYAFTAACGDQAHATMELNDRAIVVWGKDELVKEITEWAESGDFSAAGHEEVTRRITERYGDSVRVEDFFKTEFEELSNGQKILIPVREAVVNGRIPPIEGLGLDEAMILLGLFGFSVSTDREFSSMTDAEKITELINSEGPLLVLNGTGPFDGIIIYTRGSEEQKQ